MYVNLDLYRVFHAVAQARSFSGAARRLYVSQPALTQAIKKLEEQLGVQLFQRTPRGVSLTPEGETLFRHVDSAYGLITAAEKRLAQVRSLDDGEIAVGAGDTLCKHYLVPHLRAFHAMYPNVRIHVTNRTTPETTELLKAGKVDLGIVNLPLPQDPPLSVEETLEVHDCFVAGPEFEGLKGQKITLQQLSEYPLLLLEKGSNSRRFLDTYARSLGVTLRPEIELGSNDLLVEFAAVGLGIACVIREFVSEELASGRIFEVQLAEEIPARGAGLVTMKDVPLSRAASELARLLRGAKP
jgi:DNA-binding transcriptional LysR family regulator